MAGGGFIVYEAFHERDAAAGRKRLKAGRALRGGELAAAFEGCEPLIVRDGVERDGRVFSQLLARRLPAATRSTALPAGPGYRPPSG